MRDCDRGQSEALGFLLIFGVVVLTIALVGVAGFTGLDNVQDFQRTSNAEQAFRVLADNVDDVVGDGAPGRSTEVRISDASLSLASTETIAITDDDGSIDETVETRPIVYDSGTGTNVTYHSGAVIREDDGSAVLLRAPGFVITDDVVVLPLVNASAAGAGRVGGTTAVTVRTRAAGTEVVAADESVGNLTLTVSSPDAEAWERYFERHADGGPVTNVVRNGDSVEVEIETERVYVTDHRIDVRFQ